MKSVLLVEQEYTTRIKTRSNPPVTSQAKYLRLNANQ